MPKILDNRVSEREHTVKHVSLPTRESRKASRGALEEPEDEIFWDSDEVRCRGNPVASDVKSHSTATTSSADTSLTKNMKAKGKSSSGVRGSGVSLAAHSPEHETIESPKGKGGYSSPDVDPPASSKPKSSKPSSKSLQNNEKTTTPNSLKTPQNNGTNGKPTSGAKSNARSAEKSKTGAGVKLSAGIKRKNSLEKPSNKSSSKIPAKERSVKELTVKEIKLDKVVKPEKAIKCETPLSNTSSNSNLTKVTSNSNKQVAKTKSKVIKKDILEQLEQDEININNLGKEEQSEEQEGEEEKAVEEQVEDQEEEQQESVEEEKEEANIGMSIEVDQLTDEDFEEEQDVGLRRSSRRPHRPSWLLRPRRLRGYPSHVPDTDGGASKAKPAPPTQFSDDSEDALDSIRLFSPAQIRRSRKRHRPLRYQEDTEEEEEISRGLGRPRGYKTSVAAVVHTALNGNDDGSGQTKHYRHRKVSASSTLQTKNTRARRFAEAAAVAGSPRRLKNKMCAIRPNKSILMSDDDDDEDEEEQALVVRPRRIRHKRTPYINDSETENEEFSRVTRNRGKHLPMKIKNEEEGENEDDTELGMSVQEATCLPNDQKDYDKKSGDPKTDKAQNKSYTEVSSIIRRCRGRHPRVVVTPLRSQGEEEGLGAPGKEEEEGGAEDAAYTEEEEGEEEEEEEEEEEAVSNKRKKRRLDPVLRSYDTSLSLESFSDKKRIRRPIKRLCYKRSYNNKNNNSDDDGDGNSSSSSSSSAAQSSSLNSFENKQVKSDYTLRGNRNQRRQHAFAGAKELRSGGGGRHRRSYIGSPARKAVINFKHRVTNHNKSSTSSSSDEGGGDETRFEKRRAKSNAKIRSQMCPINMTEADMQHSTIKDRSKVGSSLADVEPMMMDRSITFASVGGLSSHVRSLREMVVLPLLYPEVFSKFSVTPPRGVLFHGPPGTGKTLVARALANECSRGDKKVAFFMRKGADCLSKWVGESERQLRLLFDQAYQMRPSIIFFDEIDGLAPVRSSRQDQIHSSIVSTLLALMDGLDSRGEMIVIGATNRIEAIDPALRRPGRFDRELCFPLPTFKARQQILQVHTNSWTPRPSARLIQFLADQTVGYCGADLRSLCCEAVLASFRQRYPQVYGSDVKLQLEVDTINVRLRHFRSAMSRIVPAGQRSRGSVGQRLHTTIRPLLKRALDQAISLLAQVFPQGLARSNGAGGVRRVDYSAIAYRPRLLLVGGAGQGQSSFLAPALVHAMEEVPVHKLDLAALYSNSSRTPEEAVAQIIQEARSRPPSIVYMPHVDRWLASSSESVKATLFTLLDDLNPSVPVLLLATAHTNSLGDIDEQAGSLFNAYRGEIITMTNPTREERKHYFAPLFYKDFIRHRKVLARRRVLQPLPVAAVGAPRRLSVQEAQRLTEVEEATLRELRIFLRQICSKLARNRQFCIFSQPVDQEDVPDYRDIIGEPIDLETMMTKIDQHEYTCAQDFLNHIDLICSNALEYNPNYSPEDQHIRHTACALRDTAYTLIKTEMDSDFEDKCRDIRSSRRSRVTAAAASEPDAAVPDFVYTKKLQNGNGSNGSSGSSSKAVPSSTSNNNKNSNNTSNGRVPSSSCSSGSRKKRKRKNAWAKGTLPKLKKKMSLEKAEDNKQDEVAAALLDTEDDDEEEEEDDDEGSVRDVDSTNAMDVTTAEKCAIQLCNGELSTEDSLDAPLAVTAAAVARVSSAGDATSPPSSKPAEAAAASSTAAAAGSSGSLSSPTRRRSSAGGGVGSRKAVLTAAGAATTTTNKDQELDDTTVSSSERGGGGGGGSGSGSLVDFSHLDAAFESCVDVTSGTTVAQLQQLHASLSRLVRTHATCRDKASLLTETEAEIRKFFQLKDKM